MKRLVGGDYLLDLTPIDIEESVDVETYTNITNTEVIAQLTNLKKYVSNPSMIKPVWVKLKNGETDELVVARGELKVVDTGEFEICVQLNGYKLVISIEFTQATLEDDTPIDDWYIDTNDAKYLFLSDAQSVGVAISGGGVSNAKPIYCHPISLSGYATHKVSLICLIFNNDETPITKTTFKSLLSTFTGRLLVNGIYYDVSLSKYISVSYISPENYPIGFTLDGEQILNGSGQATFNTIIDYDDVTLSDSVNKIN